MINLEAIPFKQARWFKPATDRHRRKIVLHTMEAPERAQTAENVASYFQRLLTPASAHYCIDSDSIVQCVQTRDIAYGAPGANSDGVHIELAGYASQGSADWQDAYSQAMLKNAARLCGLILCPKLGIPVVYLDAEKLRADPAAKGFTTHRAVGEAFHQTTHTDPGGSFPMPQFLGFVISAMRGELA